MVTRATITVFLVASGAVLAACAESSGPHTGVASRFDIVTGDLQRATVGTELPSALEVKVTDDNGNAVGDAVVNFVVTAGGGHLLAGAVLTDADGVAKEHWTLGTSSADTQRVEVRAVDSQTGQARVFATFRALGTPDVSATLAKFSGDAQSAPPGSALPQPVIARVTDKYGNAVPGVAVTFTAQSGQATPTAVTTDAAGLAASMWTLGTQLDVPQSVTASAAALPAVVFSAAADLKSVATLSVIQGPGTGPARAGEALPAPVIFRLALPDGRPLSGAVVVIHADNNGAPLHGIATTDGDGRITVTWRLGPVNGVQTLLAEAEGGPQATVTVDARIPGEPGSLTLVSGAGQQQLGGHQLPNQIGVLLTDAFGTPIVNAPIAYSTSTGVFSRTIPGIAYTDGQGIARTTWQVGTPVGQQVLHVYAQPASGFPQGPSVDVTAVALDPSQFRIAIVSGNNQHALDGSQLPDPFVVRVTDTQGNPAPAIYIDWRLPACTPDGGQSVGSSFTDQNGESSFSYVARPSCRNEVQAAVYPSGPFPGLYVPFTFSSP